MFRELAGRFDLDLWILGDIRELREWTGEAPEGAFRWRKLPHWGLGFGSRYARLVVNPTVRRELTAGAWDAVIACGWDTPAVWYAAHWAQRRGVPFILWSGSTDREGGALRSLTLPLVRWVVPKADAWIAYGSRAKSYLAAMGADPARTFIAYNTVDTGRFAAACAGADRDVLRKSLDIATPFTILFCGNLLPLKGLDTLLPAFADLAAERDDATLLLVGSGAHETRYRAMAESLGIGGLVRWAGYIAPEGIPDYYAAADLLVLPSLCEVWGLVVNEALACGVPVLLSGAAGASADIVRDGVNGFVVPPGDRAALTGALRRFFADPALREAMRREAAPSIAPYSIGAMADAFEEAVACAAAPRS